MSISVFALVVLIVVALCIWLVDLAPLPVPVNNIVKVAVVLIGLVVILNRAGML